MQSSFFRLFIRRIVNYHPYDFIELCKLPILMTLLKLLIQLFEYIVSFCKLLGICLKELLMTFRVQMIKVRIIVLLTNLTVLMAFGRLYLINLLGKPFFH